MKNPFLAAGAALRRDLGTPAHGSPRKAAPAAVLCLLALLACRLPAAEPTAPVAWVSAETRLLDAANDPAWRELVLRLAPNKTRQSAFEERRYFPFKRTPVVLTGEIRIVPEIGLSLRYLTPEEQTMIVDRQGLLMRDRDGRERAAPSDNRAQAATAALVNVLRFDLAKLQQEFDVHGRREGAAWSLAFVPRDANFAQLLGVLSVAGEGNALTKIEMVKSPTQRIEITVRDTREDVLFTGDTIRRFFR
ncbi:MAG: outer membrane lipoprotein carrier protein LolA [Opitutaceae bacterium]|nr:outer membrane lipoprotein carrier protein LolA [Opitutaceae bacterium]